MTGSSASMPFAAGVGTPVQYLFDRSDAAGAPGGLAVSRDVALRRGPRRWAWAWMRCASATCPRCASCFPGRARRRSRSSWRPASTRPRFARRPGWRRCGRAPRTAVPGLVLAGAWTDTGWPATLEGAVLSGHGGAAQALRALGGEAQERRVVGAAPAVRGDRGDTSDVSDALIAAPLRLEALLIRSAARGAQGAHKTGMGRERRAEAAARSLLARARSSAARDGLLRRPRRRL